MPYQKDKHRLEGLESNKCLRRYVGMEKETSSILHNVKRWRHCWHGSCYAGARACIMLDKGDVGDRCVFTTVQFCKLFMPVCRFCRYNTSMGSTGQLYQLGHTPCRLPEQNRVNTTYTFTDTLLGWSVYSDVRIGLFIILRMSK